jgi:hypothetical protein
MSLDLDPPREWNNPENGKSGFTTRKVQSAESLPPIDPGHRNGEKDADGTTDPLIQGLVERLPKLDTTWSLEDRRKWLRTAASIFGLVYKAEVGDDQGISIGISKDETRHWSGS